MKQSEKLIILLFILIMGCHTANTQNAKNKDNTNKKTTKNMLPSEIINKEFERLDIQWLEDNATEKTPIGVNNNFSFKYKDVDNIGSILISGDCESGYVYYRFFNDSYFAIFKRYYPNGYIKEKGWNFNQFSHRSEKGSWYYFNNERDLIKIWDFDKQFPYSFDDVIKFCKNEKIPLEKGDIPFFQSGVPTQISRSYSEILDSATWTILYKIGGNQLEEITIDGKTGEVINRRPLEIIGA